LKSHYEFLQDLDTSDTPKEEDYIKYCRKSSIQPNNNYVEISKNNLQRIMEDLTNVTKERNFLLNKSFHQDVEITILKSKEIDPKDEGKENDIKSFLSDLLKKE
jgi:hypothetical protein